MQGNPQIIATLNALLADELAARDQYFIHARMLHNWGLGKLAARLSHEVEDETGHAKALIDRILFLEGTPAMTPSGIKVGRDVPEMLKNDLAVELMVVRNLRAAIAQCEQERDYVTREILEPMLDDTEDDHAHWLEQQLGLIDLVGLPNYLQSQMGGSGS